MLMLIATANLAPSLWRWSRHYQTVDPLAGSPRVFLWAWDRPEDLEFLDPHSVGVAVLAKTLILNGSSISVHPRMQPIRLRAGISPIAVVRIESLPSKGGITADIREQVVRQVLSSVAATQAVAAQVDFDARASERNFYRDLLGDLRKQLPPGMRLSMTALASWCIYDDWISSLPVDEAVPMLFRLGTGSIEVKRYLAAGNEFRAAHARFSIGMSMDELPSTSFRDRRIYIFNPNPWTRESVNEVLRYVGEWR